jgi:hypothetical protein
MAPADLPRSEMGKAEPCPLFDVREPVIEQHHLPSLHSDLRSRALTLLNEAYKSAAGNTRIVDQHLAAEGYAVLALDFNYGGKPFRFWLLKDGPPYMKESPLGSKDDLKDALDEANQKVKELVVLSGLGGGGACVFGLALTWLIWGFSHAVGFTLFGGSALMAGAWFFALARGRRLVEREHRRRIQIRAAKAGIIEESLGKLIRTQYGMLKRVWKERK